MSHKTKKSKASKPDSFTNTTSSKENKPDNTGKMTNDPCD